ncbi:MAG: hypothetical protein ABI678_03930 [Kofleriaceae bacterium]
MRSYLPLLLLLTIPACAQATPSPAWTKIWEGPVEKVANHWAVPSLDARSARTDLEVSVGISVESVTSLTEKDVVIILRAGKRTLACDAQWDGYTETLAITAQPAARCHNPDKLVPTEVVVIVKGEAHTFPIKLTS